MKLNRLISIALVGFTLALVGSQLVAQTGPTQKADGRRQTARATERFTVRDKSKPVRRALEEMYLKIAEAQLNEDIEALRAIRTPDFTVDTPNGGKWDLDDAMNYSRAGFQQVESNISLTNTIESLDVQGNPLPGCAEGEGPRLPPATTSIATSLPLRSGECAVAVAVVHQVWSRMQMKGGRLRRIDTEAIQTETWVNTKDGWRLKHIGNVKPGAWRVDGKRVDPTRPYDPDAPEYRPQ